MCLFSDAVVVGLLFFFFKQKSSYEMRISDWSSDVCSSDLSSTRWSICTLPVSSRPAPPSDQRRYNALSRAVGRSCASASPSVIAALHRRLFSNAPHGRRSEERRDGKEGASTRRSRWSP